MRKVLYILLIVYILSPIVEWFRCVAETHLYKNNSRFDVFF